MVAVETAPLLLGVDLKSGSAAREIVRAAVEFQKKHSLHEEVECDVTDIVDSYGLREELTAINEHLKKDGYQVLTYTSMAGRAFTSFKVCSL